MTWPGSKQVYRRRSDNGSFDGDFVTLASDVHPDGEDLIAPVMRAGKRIAPAETLERIRERCSEQLASLPGHLTALGVTPKRYPVQMSPRLKELADEVDNRIAGD